MIDSCAVLLEWLRSDTALTTLATSGHIGSGPLPDSANPGAGEKWLTFAARGGKAETEIDGIFMTSFELTSWAKSHKEARSVYRAALDLLHGKNNVLLSSGYICASIEEIHGQDTIDPETGWAMVISYFQITMRATA